MNVICGRDVAVMKVNCGKGNGGGKGERAEGVAGPGMKVECPRGRWEIYGEQWAKPNLFCNAAACNRHLQIVLIRKLIQNGNRRCEDQPHNHRASREFRSQNEESGWLGATSSASFTQEKEIVKANTNQRGLHESSSCLLQMYSLVSLH